MIKSKHIKCMFCICIIIIYIRYNINIFLYFIFIVKWKLKKNTKKEKTNKKKLKKKTITWQETLPFLWLSSFSFKYILIGTSKWRGTIYDSFCTHTLCEKPLKILMENFRFLCLLNKNFEDYLLLILVFFFFYFT